MPELIVRSPLIAPVDGMVLVKGLGKDTVALTVEAALDASDRLPHAATAAALQRLSTGGTDAPDDLVFKR